MTPLPARGDRIPALELPSADTNEPVSLRGGRAARVLFTVHPDPCSDCDRYLRTLADAAGAVAEWGGRIYAVTTGAAGRSAEPGRSTPDAIPLLSDADSRFGGGASVIVADPWGEVYFSTATGPDHELPSPGELVEWVRFISIQCPECEGPEGEWRSL